MNPIAAMPPEQKKQLIKYGIIVVICIIIFFILKSIWSKLTDSGDGDTSRANTTERNLRNRFDRVSVNTNRLMLSPGELDARTIQLYNSMADPGTNEQGIYSALMYIQGPDGNAVDIDSSAIISGMYGQPRPLPAEDIKYIYKKFGVRAYGINGDPGVFSGLWDQYITESGIIRGDLIYWLEQEGEMYKYTQAFGAAGVL